MKPSALCSAVLFVLFGVPVAAVAGDAGVRIRFGLNDREPTVWNGSVAVQPGKVVSVSGWRFEQGDKAEEASWTASTRPVAATPRTNVAKAKAGAKGEGKAGAAAKAKAKAGAGTSGLADNGVLITLTEVTEDFNLGGFEPLGFVNLALLKGYKFSFQSSSDHGSTHISNALVYAENNSREAMFKAMKQRHTYAATDNIIADYRCTADGREYMMGDAFTSKQPPTVRIKLIGTQPFAKVTLVKDDVEHVLAEPNKAEIELTWTDPQPTPGKESYYYVRGEQTDGELVWASPMWITYKP